MAESNCTDVTATCPFQASTIGYYPSISANAVPAVFFLIALIIQLFIGIRHQTWSCLVAVGIGSLSESAGYLGRIMLHKNPYSSGGFRLQIICLTVAPAFIAAGLYLNPKHMVYVFGPHLSLLKPALYTHIFIGCDILSIAMQAVGAGLAASGTNVSAATIIILGGLSFQVFTMVAFVFMSGIFFLKVSQSRGELNRIEEYPRFQAVLVSLALAHTTVLVRCIFRVAAFAGGWRNSLELNQTDFIALDTAMMLIAVILLTFFHPGYFFGNKALRQIPGAPDDIELINSNAPKVSYLHQ